LTEKGYRVGVLETGRRFADDEFAKNSWHLREYLWAPKLGCFGMQRLTLLNDTFIMSGSGVGGGSLVYANTLYEAPDTFYGDKQWAHITDWKSDLAPHYDQAKRMLGVTTNPATAPSDRVLQEVAEDMGIGDTYRRTPVGVLFADKETRPGTRSPIRSSAVSGRSDAPNVVRCHHRTSPTTAKASKPNTPVKRYRSWGGSSPSDDQPPVTARCCHCCSRERPEILRRPLQPKFMAPWRFRSRVDGVTIEAGGPRAGPLFGRTTVGARLRDAVFATHEDATRAVQAATRAGLPVN